MLPGDQIMWRHKMRGGYGYAEWIPGGLVKINPKTLRIRVRRKDGSIVERNVKSEHVRTPNANERRDYVGQPLQPTRLNEAGMGLD